MGAAARRGASLRTVARRFRVGVATVPLWGQRARPQRRDRVDWADRPPLPRTIRRTETAGEDLVLTVRRARQATSARGADGAAAMRRERLQRGRPVMPSRRTSGRMLARRGALEARPRVRRRPPPLGGSRPEVAAARAEVDRVDSGEDLVIARGPQVEGLHVSARHGGVVGSWPRPGVTAPVVPDALREHWRA